MSRFRNEVAHLESHVNSLRRAAAALFGLSLVFAFGWWQAPRDLTIHVPPDLRSGSVRKWWDVPPESVYAFAIYVFQQLNRWPSNGEQDGVRNLQALASYLTPACKGFLEEDLTARRNRGELRQRMRGIYEIPGHGYGDDPLARVKPISADRWLVTLDVIAEEFYGDEPVKRVAVRYPIKVMRWDIDAKKNPFGLALDCYSGTPERLQSPLASAPSAEPTHSSPARDFP